MDEDREDETPEPVTPPHGRAFSDARGVSRLTVDAATGITDIVEDVHRAIAGVASPFSTPRPGRARGITGLVYRSVRRIIRTAGVGVDAVLTPLAPLLSRYEVPHRDAALAVLNGVVGDHLAATGNPLAIPMHLRRDGQPLALDAAPLAPPPVHGRLLILAHGLCMDDRGWQRDGHDHGAALARDLDYLPLYLRYNSGQAIGTNGRAFADALERLAAVWPVPVTDLVIVGHSMGGLVARSACHYAEQADHAWLRALRALVFLGTPHHGAPLERAGNGVDRVLGASRFTAPFARLGLIRSAGVQDLRYGAVLEDRAGANDTPAERVALPNDVPSFAIAATKQREPDGAGWATVGDGLVPVYSALGQHRDEALALSIPPSHRQVFYGLGHFDLLSSRAVYDSILHWLGEERQAPLSS